MIEEIVIPGPFEASNSLHWVRGWNEVQETLSLRVVLPTSTFLYPSGIALLASCLKHRQELGCLTELRGDRESDAFRYLQRINLFNCLGVTVAEEFTRRDSTGRFIPLESITSNTGSYELARRIVQCISGGPDAQNSVDRRTTLVLQELGCNITQHAQAGNTGFGVGQVFPKIAKAEFAYCDYGRGIRASLEQNFELAGRIGSDVDAVRLALEEGISGNPDPVQNAGIGLHELDRACRDMRGALWLVSGSAYFHRDYSGPEVREHVRDDDPPFKGTLVCFRVPQRARPDLIQPWSRY